MTLLKRRYDDRGSASLEAAIAAPAFVLLVGLIIFGGRTAMTHQAVESAAAEAARSASIARSSTEATAGAKQAAKTSLANQDLQCLSIYVSVDTSDFSKPIGEPGQVTVTVECRLDLSDLSVPGVPGSRIISATMTSPLDTWRGRS
jgi:Flp pilus assembly protein TadG